MKLILLNLALFSFFVLFSTSIIMTNYAFAEDEPILPEWIRNVFVWYADNEISEGELLQAIEFLVDECIINVNSCSMDPPCPSGQAVDGKCEDKLDSIPIDSSLISQISDTSYGPVKYTSFKDTLFSSIIEQSEYFFIDDFEDKIFNLFGVAAKDAIIIEPGTKTESVDAEDGELPNGKGSDGHSFYSGSGTITFTFDEDKLGKLPTYAGVVVTYAQMTAGRMGVEIIAYDSDNNPVGSSEAGFFYNTGEGTPADDKFIGVSYSEGIKSVQVKPVVDYSRIIQVDHFQFGWY